MSVTVTITDVNGNPISVVDASAIAAYRVNIAYSCSVESCTNAQVAIAAPPKDPYYDTQLKERSVTYTPPFTPAPALGGTLAGGYTINLGTVTAGTNGLIRLDYTVNTRNSNISGGNFFPDGSPITPSVTMTSSNAPTVSDTASATWKSYIPTPSLTISAPTVVTAGTQMTVTTGGSSWCWSAPTGVLRSIPWYLCNNTGYHVVQLPANAVYVAGSGGTYDPVTHRVTLSSGPNAWTGVGGSFKVTFPTSAYPTSGPGCTADETFNVIDAKYTYLDGTVKATAPATAARTVTVGNCAPFAKADVAKSSKISGGQYSSNVWTIPITGGYAVQWFVTANNRANVPGVATIVDNALDQADLPVTSISVTAGGPATIQYTLDNGTVATATNVTSFTAPAGRRIVAVTATSSTLAGPNIRPTDTGGTPFTLVFAAVLSSTATPGTRTNTASATMTYPANPALGTIVPTGSPSSRTVTLVAPATPYTINASNPVATVTDGGVALPGSEVVWTANGSATNVTPTTAWTPQYVFLAPLGWDIAPNGASLATPVPGATFAYQTVTFGGQSRQAVIVSWPGPVTGTGTITLPALSVKTAATGAAPAGTSTAQFFVGDVGNAFATGYSPARTDDTTDIDLDGVTTDAFARGTGSTPLAASPKIGITKEICQPDPSAADGCNWVSDSSVLVGVPPSATSIKYRVTLTNTGNSTLSNLVAYDVLPFIGDTGTTTATAGTPRGSTVTEVLASVSNVTAGVTLAYSTSTNPPRPEVYSGATSGTWAAPVAGASSIRATVTSLASLQSESFVYTASLVGGSADQTACNSVAANAPTLEAIEPAPVCATTQEADFSVQTTNRYPLQEGRVGIVPFVVNNGGGSQLASGTVALTVPAGLSIADLVIPGWDCTAPSMTGPVTVSCVPVNPDLTSRSLALNVPETIPLKVIPASGTGETALCIDASVAGLIYDPVLSNNEASSCATLFTGLVDVSKTDGVTSTSPGATLTYTVTATNKLVAEGITGAVITDALPSNVKFVSASDGGVLSGADGSGNGGTVTWPAVDLAAAGTPNSTGTNGSGAAGSTITRTVTVQVITAATGNVVNATEITAPDPADPAVELIDTATDIDTLLRLTVTKSNNAAAAGVRTSDVVTYTVTLTNDGTADYTAGSPASLVDDLSGVLDDATFVAGSASASVNGGAGSPVANPVAGRLSWSGPLTAGSSVVVTYQVTAGVGAAGDALVNTAYAAATPSSCANGLTPASASCATVTTQFAPLLAKTVTSSVQNDDGTWTTVYSVAVTNVSPTAAATYTLNDVLALGSGITVVSAAVTSAPAGVTPAVWSGTGPIVTGASIPANSQHTYQLTVVTNAGTVGGTAAATCAAGVAGGFANRATLTTTDGRTAAAEACASPVEPTVDKTVAAPVQLPDGRWSIVYTITVSNPNPAPSDLAYTLGDVLSVPASIMVDSVAVTGPAGAPINAGFNGTSDTALLTGADRIPAGSAGTPATRVFTVTVIVQPPSGTPTALACPPAGSGGYANTVTLLSGTSATALGTDSACADATPQPMPSITKQVVSSAIDTSGVWTIVYDIAVTNDDPLYSTIYSLDDGLGFAAGVTVVSAQVASSSATVSATWNGVSDLAVAAGVSLPPATTHQYTVTVVADPGSLDPESALADCRIDAGETGTGFQNSATVTSGVESAFATACQPFTDPSVVKTTAGVPTQDPATGLWTLDYEVTVTNRSTTTMGTIPYTLSDEFGFPAGVLVTDVTTTAPTGGTVNPSFDGASDTALGSGAIGAAVDETTPAVQRFTVSVQFTVPAGITTGAQCDPAQGPGGLRNEVEVAVGSRISGAVACADLPDVPVPGLTKTVLSQEQQADGTWLLLYRIVVANPSGTAASEYTLDDALALGAGMTVVSDPTIVAHPLGVTVEPDWNGDDATTVAEDILLPAAGSHTYTVRAVIDAGAVRGSDAAGDCTLDSGETGTGFLNTATIDTGAATADAEVCAQASDPAVTKELNGEPVQQADGSWLLSYTMTVSNPSAVPLSYGLVDELDFPAGTVVTVESAAGRAGSPAVEPDWDGEAQTQLVADGTPLPPNAIHVFDVTLSAVLPDGQDSQADGWANTATVESGVGGVISTEADALADILIPELSITKEVIAPDELIRIGDTVEYQITIENVGEGNFTAVYPAVFWDDLADVLDDGDLTDGPDATPDVGSFAIAGDSYRFESALLAGDSVTITYTVTVADDGGNANLVNVAFVAEPLEDEPVTPPITDCADPVCAFTETPLAALQITKTVDQTVVAPSGVANYTVTVTNSGNVDIPADDPATITDDLSQVLGVAAHNNDATADIGTVEFIGSTLIWTGGLAVGETATITYSVTVDANAPNGTKLKNLVTADPTLLALSTDGSEAVRQVTTTSTVQKLASTGFGGGWTIALIAALLLLGGAGLVIVQLRRRRLAPSSGG